MKSIVELEKEFYTQRDKIVKELNKNKQKLQKELNKLLAKVSILKQKQREVQLLISKAKKNLKLTQQKLNKNKRQIIEDTNKIKFMKKRIKQLKGEIPIFERTIKKIIPERNKLTLRDRKLTRLLMPLNKQIANKQEMINKFKLQIKKLNKKENFIKQGRIVWGEFKKIRRKIFAKKKKMEQKPKLSLFNKLFKR